MEKWNDGDEGKLFLVIYNDDTGHTRSKKLIFKKSENNLVWFFNPLKNVTETIPSTSIIRMEEIL